MSIAEIAEPRVGPRLSGVVAELRSIVSGIDPDDLLGSEAASLTTLFAEVERLGGAGKTLTAGRAEQEGAYRALGFPNPAQWLAARTGGSLSRAHDTLRVAKLLRDPQLAPTRRAFTDGRLSSEQATEIAGAASSAPESQDVLLKVAERDTFKQLRERAQQVRQAARSRDDEEKRHRDAIARRSLRATPGDDGMTHVRLDIPTWMWARLIATIEQQAEHVFKRARKDGRREGHDRYLLDAVVALVLWGLVTADNPFNVPPASKDAEPAGEGPAGDDSSCDSPSCDDAGPNGDGSDDESCDHESRDDDLDEWVDHPPEPGDPPEPGRGGSPPAPPPPGAPPPRPRPRPPRAKIICRVDITAVQRGHAEAGETCDIPGVGPVSLAGLRALLPDAMIACVLTKGADVLHVTHAGRRATAAMRTAMEWSVPHCSNIACDNTLQIQHDHRIDFAATHHTRLDESDHVCDVCHDLKTTQNWQLVEGTGRRQFVPPGHPLHPGTDHRRGRRP